jgi:HSP20 family protein
MGKRVSDIWDRLILFQNKMNEITNEIDEMLTSAYLILPSDILEYEHNLIIKIDIPGMDENNIRIHIENRFLVIEGYKSKDINDNVRYILAERRFGKFKNIIELPADFDMESISYYIKNGVLIVKIEKFRLKEG